MLKIRELSDVIDMASSINFTEYVYYNKKAISESYNKRYSTYVIFNDVEV